MPMLHLEAAPKQVEIAPSSIYDLGAAFTVEAIVKLDTLVSGSQLVVGQWGDPGARKASWKLNVVNGGLLRFSLHSGTVTKHIDTPSAVVSAGKLHHLSAVYENKFVRLYVDGNLVHSGAVTIAPQPSSDYAIRIGLSSSGGGSVQGLVAEVRFWGIARTPEEIAAWTKKPLMGNETGLLGYWPLTEGAGTAAVDKSPNANHGTIIGDAHWTTTWPYRLARCLFEDGGEIKKPVASEARWETLGPAPATPEMFETHGLTDLSGVSDSLLRLLNAPRLLALAPLDIFPVVEAAAVPSGRLVYPAGDMPIGLVDKIRGFSLVFNQTVGGLILLLASADSGQTWKAWDGTNWIVVDHNDLDDVKSKGMSPPVFNLLAEEQWSRLFEGQADKKLRFAYYLEQDSAAEQASTDALVGTFDMRGTWDGAVLGQEYTYGYPTNDTLTIRLLADGSYKVNY